MLNDERFPRNATLYANAALLFSEGFPRDEYEKHLHDTWHAVPMFYRQAFAQCFFVRELYDTVLEAPRAQSASLGMRAFVMLVAVCDEVTLFGFGRSTSGRTHYHSAQSEAQNRWQNAHAFGAEEFIFHIFAANKAKQLFQLIDQNILKGEKERKEK